jgi:predicted dehydrogenase
MGIHAIGTARFLVGDADPGRVVASLSTSYGHDDVDDDGVVLVDWSDRVRSTIELGWWQPHLDGVAAPPASPERYGRAAQRLDHGRLTTRQSQAPRWSISTI